MPGRRITGQETRARRRYSGRPPHRRAKAALCTPRETGRRFLHGSKTPLPSSGPSAKRHQRPRDLTQVRLRCRGFVRPDCGPFQGIRGHSWASPVDRADRPAGSCVPSQKYRTAICAIAGVYPLFSQPAFPADPYPVQIPTNDGAPRHRCNGKDQAMNLQAPLRLEQNARSLEGRVSLVTGSTSGIGLGIARALAAAGSAVVLNGFGKPEDIAETQARIVSEFGVKVHYSPADMSKAAPIADMIATALDTFGRVDVLVNNAGIQHVAPLEQFPLDKSDAFLAINLSSAFHTTRGVLPSMRKNKFGRIINIASAHGLIASPFKSAYVAAKH